MADFTISGNGLRKLQAMGDKVTHLAAAKRAIAVNQAEEAIDLIAEGFREQRDPYGTKWQKRKRETKRTRGRKVLSGETSMLQRGWKRRDVGSGGFRVSPSVDYAPPHQSPKRGGKGGGLKRPRRMMVPNEKRGLGRVWRKALREVASDALTDYLTKGKQ